MLQYGTGRQASDIRFIRADSVQILCRAKGETLATYTALPHAATAHGLPPLSPLARRTPGRRSLFPKLVFLALPLPLDAAVHPVVRKPEPRVLNARHPRAARHLPLLSRRRRRHRRLASCRRLEEKVLVLGLEAGYDLSCVLCDDHTSRYLQLGHTGGRSAGLQCRVAVPSCSAGHDLARHAHAAVPPLDQVEVRRVALRVRGRVRLRVGLGLG